ncbi:cytosolic phospholipase A2 gamma-like [Pseudorasbora parva]|uniref:cytosolic phospholipase A2 gamma-like n=1 Tax=Pseudorasbora parva TaxID=51549 RepID=UPI00351F5640
MSGSETQESGEVRIGHSLNKNEEEFVAKRRKDIHQSLKKLEISCSENEVPNIALLGSGGGERAMVGLLGSLDQLKKTGLLDCILYLSGISGSTWCMASLYKEPDWSTQLDTVKDNIINRLTGPKVSWEERCENLKRYYAEKGKDMFSLTDVWAVMFVKSCVKEIDQCTLTEQQNKHDKDPFPIYAVIDSHSKKSKDADPWFEFTPYEAGYSLTGAFVETSSFGSQFDNGCKIKDHPEMDMLYLQGLCGSALADGEEIRKFLWEKIEDFFKKLLPPSLKTDQAGNPGGPSTDEFNQVLMDLVDMNISVLEGNDPSEFDESIRAKLTKLSGGKHQLIISTESLNLADKEAAKQFMEQYTEDVCNALNCCSSSEDKQLTEGEQQQELVLLTDWHVKSAIRSISSKFKRLEIYVSICKCMAQWKWGRNYGFLHNITDEAVPSALRQNKIRHYEDAGLLLNSPYFSVLRKARDIDLIISLDFSDDKDPFTTVKETAETCRELNIPFPEVNIPKEDIKNPKDFYVFKGQNTPTVIHIPLFNVVNCGDKMMDWKNRYKTFQRPYSTEMITDLMEVAGKNITNNVDNLKQQIRLAMKNKNNE